MAKKQRSRRKFEFWLDFFNRDELVVADTIDQLKRERSFASAVRDGIMLVAELRQGRVDLLLKLFPWVEQAIAPAPEPQPNYDELRQHFSRLESLLRDRAAAAPVSSKPISLDDDMDTVIIRPAAGGTGGVDNFLSSFDAFD